MITLILIFAGLILGVAAWLIASGGNESRRMRMMTLGRMPRKQMISGTAR